MNLEKKKELIFIAIFALIAVHPIIELDYLAYEFLNNIGIPRLTTLVNFIFYPLLVLLAFWFFDRNKKRTLIVFGIYAVLFGAYFVLHCKNCGAILENGHLYLPDNFYFSAKDEIVYTITLLLPLVYIYVFNLTDIKDELLEKATAVLSSLVSLPIVISNLLIFGYSTYGGYTLDNVFSWFSLPYDAKIHEPRNYSTKFFFEEGNVIGILLLLILPILYYCFFKQKEKKKKIALGIIIFIQSIAMIILSTRVATFGAVGVPAVMLVYYLVLCLLKKEEFKKGFVAFLTALTVITAVFLPYCPAVQNQLLDARSYEFQKTNDDYLNSQRELAKREVDFAPFSEEWLNYYIYMFEDYSFLIRVTPPAYFEKYYDYHFDPKFWVDLIFDYPLEERIDGRQIEQIFTTYKFDQLDKNEQALGMGYSTFMWGSIVIERDFVQQYYSYGLIGWLFVMLPWFVLLAYSGIKLVFNYKKWTFKNITFMMICCLGFGCAYTSGHTLDQLSCGMILGLAFGILIKELRKKNETEA